MILATVIVQAIAIVFLPVIVYVVAIGIRDALLGGVD